ncbi:unnamed protein product [Ilex paraguariensis]|uniref:Cytochrome P450 n=1 Tax=Ilex paraguariensis TaxID=185542 RepID=A0ABC8T7X2_9AQUA
MNVESHTSKRGEKQRKRLMDSIAFLLVLSFVLTCIHILTIYNSCRRNSGKARLPPGPYPFPIIGNIFELGHKPHQSLANHAKIHGPLMSLKLGSITTMVVSSPQMAKQVLQQHDQAFSCRTVTDALHALDHHKVSMPLLPANSAWRNLRKISKEQFFSMQRLHAGQGLRRKKL